MFSQADFNKVDWLQVFEDRIKDMSNIVDAYQSLIATVQKFAIEQGMSIEFDILEERWIVISPNGEDVSKFGNFDEALIWLIETLIEGAEKRPYDD